MNSSNIHTLPKKGLTNNWANLLQEEDATFPNFGINTSRNIPRKIGMENPDGTFRDFDTNVTIFDKDGKPLTQREIEEIKISEAVNSLKNLDYSMGSSTDFHATPSAFK